VSLLIKKFTKFIKTKGKGQFRSGKKENQGSCSNFKCYGCRETGHVKVDCPNTERSEEKRNEGNSTKRKKSILLRRKITQAPQSQVS